MDTAPAPDPLTDDARHAIIGRRDAAFDDRFVYAVATTGVYCRPSCAARAARRENVSFHPSCAAAERAGFRPCRRCRPNEPGRPVREAAMVREACRLMDRAETPPTLAVVAQAAGVSPFHFHRLFRRVTGITPRAYAEARRAARVRAGLGDRPGDGPGDGLKAADSVTRAIYAAGFNAPSRFYETAGDRLGMTPGRFRRGGADTAIRFAVVPCALGALLVAATEVGLCAIAFGDDPDTLVRDLRARFPQATLRDGDAGFAALVARVVGVVEAPHLPHDLPLDIRGTAFQQRVWQALRAIPAGHTVSYAGLAAAIGRPAATRAVAGACAANTLAVAVPCHRVVRSDGGLSGYRWGAGRKRALLDREAENALAPGAASAHDPTP